MNSTVNQTQQFASDLLLALQHYRSLPILQAVSLLILLCPSLPPTWKLSGFHSIYTPTLKENQKHERENPIEPEQDRKEDALV